LDSSDVSEVIVLVMDYAAGLTDIKNKTPGVEPGVCI
jgi:hypothetical protein